MSNSGEIETSKSTPNRLGGINRNSTPRIRVGLSRKFRATRVSPQANTFDTTSPYVLQTDVIHNQAKLLSPNIETKASCNNVTEISALKEIDHTPNTFSSQKWEDKKNIECLNNTTVDCNKISPKRKINKRLPRSKSSGTSANECTDAPTCFTQENICNKKENIKHISDKTVKNINSEVKYNRISPQKKLNKRLSINKSSTLNAADFIDEDLSEDDKLEENIETIVPIKKTIKRKLDLSSSDEENLTPSQESIQAVNDMNNKVAEIEGIIKKKEARLEQLKQAALYKKLHNIEKLEQLTNVWKSGCKEALTHLLSKLNQHAEINMETLLTNLKIPSNIIKYSTENDCLI